MLHPQLPGGQVRGCLTAKLLPKSQPKELNRLCLVCSAKSHREKQGSESGAHDSITACALFLGSPSLTPARAGYTQLLRAGIATHDWHIFQFPVVPNSLSEGLAVIGTGQDCGM